MSWDTAEKRAAEPSGSGVFVTLKDDNEKIAGAFVGEPYIRELIWDQNVKRYRDFTPADLAAGEKASPRFALNFFVPSKEGAGSMKIMEMNQRTFQDLVGVKNKYGLEKWFFEITRHGKKGDTGTTYQILPDVQITAQDLAAIKAAKLHDLAKSTAGRTDGDASTDLNSHDKQQTSGATNGAAAAPAPSQSADAVIDEKDALALVVRLKVMPKAKIDGFLGHFGVKTVKTVKRSDLAAAIAYVDELEGKKPEAPAEVDPFA